MRKRSDKERGGAVLVEELRERDKERDRPGVGKGTRAREKGGTVGRGGLLWVCTVITKHLTPSSPPPTRRTCPPPDHTHIHLAEGSSVGQKGNEGERRRRKGEGGERWSIREGEE